jgi:hypothetical protein
VSSKEGADLRFNFDCAVPRLLWEDRALDFSMLSVIIGALMVFSIGILIAHAMDAFRSPPTIISVG